ncbi:MAG: DUF4421 family protein [Bacteroidales bacterium]|nr:DUF4421 family protein [Bacteroidales bacterium]
MRVLLQIIFLMLPLCYGAVATAAEAGPGVSAGPLSSDAQAPEAGNPVRKVREAIDSSETISRLRHAWKVVNGSGVKDPEYLRSPDYTWKIKSTSGIAYSDLFDRGVYDGGRFRAALWSEPRIRQSFSLTWNFLSVSWGFSPFKLRGKDKDNQLSFSYYCNRFGLEFAAQEAKTYHGRVLMSPDTVKVPAGKVSSRLINLDGYYVLNFKRYSLPTALSQSFIQKKSAGSLLFSISGQLADINCAAIEDLGNRPFNIKSAVFGLGLGYGYNWVPVPRIVVSAAAIGNAMLFSRNYVIVDGERSSPGRRFPDYSLTGYFALAYQSGAWHYGLRGTVHDCCVGNGRSHLYDNVSLYGAFFIGIRIK